MNTDSNEQNRLNLYRDAIDRSRHWFNHCTFQSAECCTTILQRFETFGFWQRLLKENNRARSAIVFQTVYLLLAASTHATFCIKLYRLKCVVLRFLIFLVPPPIDVNIFSSLGILDILFYEKALSTLEFLWNMQYAQGKNKFVYLKGNMNKFQKCINFNV